jgi:hypothetical protein
MTLDAGLQGEKVKVPPLDIVYGRDPESLSEDAVDAYKHQRDWKEA